MSNCTSTASSDLTADAVRLEELTKAIERKRRSFAPSRNPSNSGWDEMLRLHRERQLKAEKSASLKGQILEGFRFDLDILKHAFGRWLLRVDSCF
jgi:hypothetical protein